MEEIRRLLDDLHNDLVALRHELKLTEARLEAKIDSKPSLMAMFTGIVIVLLVLLIGRASCRERVLYTV